MPHLWSPVLIDRAAADAGRGPLGYRPGRARWRIAVLEPNICTVKTGHVPLLAADMAHRRDPKAIAELRVFNALQMKTHPGFVAFARSLDLRPQDYWANFYHGLCSFRLGRFEDAVADFRACLAIEPGSAASHYNRALAYEALGRAEEAYRGYSRAVEIAPDLDRGAELYAQNCASCHGAKGDAKVPIAKTMDPPPIAFTDRARARERSPFALYQVIDQGLEGTMMSSFRHLPEADKWALAFHAGRFAYPAGLAAEGKRLWESDPALRQRIPDLAALASLTPAVLARDIGELKRAVADGGIRPEAEVSGGGLARYGAIARGPAHQRPQFGALDLDRSGEDGPEIAPLEAARGFEAVIARECRLEMVDHHGVVLGGERHVDGADKVAAEPRLFDDERQRAVAERGRLGWQKASGYNWRALVESDISRWKRVVGDGLRFQTDGRQASEVAIAVGVLNRMLELGRPSYVRIA